MMSIEQRVEQFAQLGIFLSQFQPHGVVKQQGVPHNDPFFSRMHEEIKRASEYNGWFTSENVLFALSSWSSSLDKSQLLQWVKPYELSGGKTIAVILAGNIPLVGFHDILAVLLSGNKALIKSSSNDRILLPVLLDYLKSLDPSWTEKITFADQDAGHLGKQGNFDAVIATGSNNTARYFEYYFGKKPHIIRRNRNSVAVLKGDERPEELEALGEDIFRYYGLGCRNVSKLYVPDHYDFDSFFKAIYPWRDIITQNKYANNYDYNKAVYLMSNFALLENGFLMLKEDQALSSPIATLFYEKYDDLQTLRKHIAVRRDEIQCVVGAGVMEGEVAFGRTQHPKLWDYADNVDTLEFLSKVAGDS